MNRKETQTVLKSVPDVGTDEIPEIKRVSNFTNKAYSICRDAEGWSFVEIDYNPLTGETGNLKMRNVGPYKDFAIEEFRIQVSKHLFMS